MQNVVELIPSQAPVKTLPYEHESAVRYSVETPDEEAIRLSQKDR